MAYDKNNVLLVEYSVIKVPDGRIGVIEVIEGDDLNVRFSFSNTIGEVVECEKFKANEVERIL